MGKYLLKGALLLVLSALLFPLVLWMAIPLEGVLDEHLAEKVDNLFLLILLLFFKCIIGLSMFAMIIVALMLLPFASPQRVSA